MNIILTVYSRGGGGNGISSDGFDRSRIFLSLKFSIRGFLVVGKFGKFFFFRGGGGELYLIRDISGIQSE